MNNEAWPESQKCKISLFKMAEPNQQSCTSQNDIDSIADQMDKVDQDDLANSSIVINNSKSNSSLINVTPEAESNRMIQNYINQNGGIIVNNTKNRLIKG